MKKRILIVEDDMAMQDIYRDIFLERQKKYSLEFADCVKSAIQKLNGNQFDLVVLDIIMEPISGEFLYLKLRTDGKLKSKRIPVIIASVVNRNSLEHLKKTNNISIFEKPINKKRFLNKVEEMTSCKEGKK